MKALKVIAQIVGYLIVALAAVMLVSGAPWACVFLLIVGVGELWLASRLLRPNPEPAEEMTEEERADFFSNMQTQMADMQTRIQDMQKSQKAYEKALKPILNKDQMKAYRKDQREREQQMSRAMSSQGGFPGGGFPGGGFPGGPGGFGGGFPGGF